MYCPRCGQQQLAENTSFCSRCGLAISGLAEWIAGGGRLAVREPEAPVASLSARRKGIRRGGKWMFFSIVLTPIFILLSFLVEEPVPLLLPSAAFLVVW